MSVKTIASVASNSQDGYDLFEDMVRRRVADAVGPLFETDAGSGDRQGLFEDYLAALPAERRQHYHCRACQTFLNRYGTLVQLSPEGIAQALLWHDLEGVPPFFQPFALAARLRIEAAKVNGVFYSEKAIWGTPLKGGWTHLAGTPATALVWTGQLLTPSQKQAEKLQEYILLRKGLDEFGPAAAEAVRVLEADALYRGEKTLGVARWLRDLYVRLKDMQGRLRDNLIWKAVAEAPPGWCHVRSTMIGTLLEDIVAGLPYEAVARRWAKKMHPLQYQRPTVLKQGAVEQAEKVVAALGSAGALARRFARLEDILTTIWTPRAVSPTEPARPAGGVFDHLKASKETSVKQLELPARTMTWKKFEAEVLWAAERMEYRLTARPEMFCALVTAADPAAPPILQWDGLEGLPRNPVSWYLYYRGSLSAAWNLAGDWVEVTAACPYPAHWQAPERFQHFAQAAVFILAGCKDLRHERSGGAFPETLHNNYHSVRQVLEAHFKSQPIAGRDEATACGLAITERTSGYEHTFRIHSGGATALYRIDRWD